MDNLNSKSRSLKKSMEPRLAYKYTSRNETGYASAPDIRGTDFTPSKYRSETGDQEIVVGGNGNAF